MTLRLICCILAAVPLFAVENSISIWTPIRGVGSPDSGVTHNGRPSIRLESPAGNDAVLQSPPVKLVVGRTYELSGWIKTEGLKVYDLDRTPVATGASLSMASMPWDVHSESLGGTTDWTKVSLRFMATRAEDRMEVRVANGGGFQGKAWMQGAALEEVADPSAWPVKSAVRTFGPAYRYPRGGWIYLHIEGEPFDRGFQHGFLMAKEIENYIDRCASTLNSKDRAQGWTVGRTVANAVFLRGFDEEILTEMKGIAEGASAAGAKYNGRKIDLIDIVAANTIVELGTLAPAVEATPTGLEYFDFHPPGFFDPKRDAPVTERCSAFAATGKATRNGHMIIGHITMWSLTLAEQTNLMLDIKPRQGCRILMQSFPGGIQSGTDWYQNETGMVLTETTIRQSPFNIQGAPVAFRARKAIQYGTNVDLVVKYLSERNNGLYTNEWLIADAKNDEIAMFELGTYKTKLWRSSKNEWFEGTEGFYWGCNNTKDLNVRLEFVPDPRGVPVHLPYMSTPRDRKWVEMYNRQKGQLDEQFAFLAFRTAPLVSSSAMDAKVTTGEIAPKMMLWALFGKPNEREWIVSPWEREQYANNEGLDSGGYRLFTAEPGSHFDAKVRENEDARLKEAPASKEEKKAEASLKKIDGEKLWKGWILPSSPDDEWLTLGSSHYREVLAAKNPEDELTTYRLRMRDTNNETRIGRAVFLFDALRRQMGEEAFLNFMRGFFEANTTRTVQGADFLAAAGLKKLPDLEEPQTGTAMLLTSLFPRLGNALIVYGTVTEAGANRHASEIFQDRLNNWYESHVPLRKDFELTPEETKTKTLIFVGRPETNSALHAMAEKLGLKFDGASFEMGGKVYSHERNGLALARTHLDNAKEMILVLAGNSPAETVRLSGIEAETKAWQVTLSGKSVASGF
jgi:hypothetical protein